MEAWIDKIVVEGFKSYGRERLDIPLGKGVIAIVGPNGAGKSNIGDALSFALGLATSKTLRAKNLSYLIFSRDGERADSAYVEVHFKNMGAFPLEQEDVVISRKVDQDGRSTFRVNGSLVRERELKELLSKVGIYENAYNVVLQGDIVRFLKMTPVERRKLIEEIAGIGEYEEKKQKALADLGEVELKIRELRLLMDEMEVQMERLSEEVKKLVRYRELQKLLRDWEIRMYMKETLAVRSSISKVEEDIKLKSSELQEIRGKIKEMEQEYAKGEEELKVINSQLFPFREKIGRLSSDMEHIQKKVLELDRKRGEIEKERVFAEEHIKRMDAELKRLLQEEKLTKAQLVEKEKEIEIIGKRVDELYNLLKGKEEGLKVSLEEASKTEERINALREEIEKERKKIVDIELKHKELEMRMERVSQDMKDLFQDKERLKAELGESLIRKENYQRMWKEEEASIRRKRQILQSAEEKLKKIRLEREEVLRQKAVLESKLSNIEGDLLPFDGIEGVYGRVADLIKVKDLEYLKAIEAAGGARLSYIVVENEEVAKECINRLLELKAGRMNFIPLNRIKTFGLPPYPRKVGVIDFAVNLVEYDIKFERAVKFVFGDTIVVESFQRAKELGIGNNRMVTLDGEVFEKSGVISGGYSEGRVSLGRGMYLEEIDRLSEIEKKLIQDEEQAEKLIRAEREDLIEKEGVLKVLERRLKEVEELDKKGFDKLREMEERLKKAEEYKSLLEEEKKRLKRERDELTDHLSYMEEKLNNLTIKKQSIMAYYRDSGIEKVRAEYEKSKSILDKLKEEAFSINMKLKDVQREIEALRTEIGRKMAFLDECQNTLEGIQRDYVNLLSEKRNLEESIKELERTAYQLYSQRDRWEDACRSIQSELGKLRIYEDSNREGLQKLELERSKLEERLKELMDKLEELNWSGTLEDVKYSYTKIKEEIGKTEGEIERLGALNFKAEEDYREHEVRYKDYKERYKKMEEEKKAIKEMIQEVETKKLRVFMESFESINRSLKRIFSELSPGGRAYMELEKEKDPFSGGINLVVKPRGKEVQYLEAISGGEKTLAALSLIFAIQEYKPSPFYYFDEVDAHLDEANARKVGELIKRRSEQAQFIVVTLREVLASFADKLIGVTSRGGISKVFPVENIRSA